MLTFPQDTFLRLHVVFQVCCCKPNLDTLTYVLNSVGKNDFRIIVVLH